MVLVGVVQLGCCLEVQRSDVFTRLFSVFWFVFSTQASAIIYGVVTLFMTAVILANLGSFSAFALFAGTCWYCVDVQGVVVVVGALILPLS